MIMDLESGGDSPPSVSCRLASLFLWSLADDGLASHTKLSVEGFNMLLSQVPVLLYHICNFTLTFTPTPLCELRSLHLLPSQIVHMVLVNPNGAFSRCSNVFL